MSLYNVNFATTGLDFTLLYLDIYRPDTAVECEL